MSRPRNGELPCRRILGKRRSRAKGRASAHAYRRHQLRIGPDKYVVLDNGSMLVHAVIVAGYGARAHIDISTDITIANVGEVIGFASRANIAGFHFDKIADVHVIFQRRARTKSRVGSYPAIRTNLGTIEVAKRFYAGIGGDLDVSQNAIRRNSDPIAENDFTLEYAIDVDLAVATASKLTPNIDTLGVQ